MRTASRQNPDVAFRNPISPPSPAFAALLTFSPCERSFVPVYVSGVRYGWHGFALLTIILTVATIAGMVAFTGLALTGIEQVKLRSFEKYEAG